MRKISKIFLLWGIVAVLTACGEASPTGNLAQNINMGGGSNSGDDKKGDNGNSGGNGEKQESETSTPGKQNEEEGVFGFVYEGVTLVPGEVFDYTVLGEYSEVAEVPSCAFDGNDRVYNYETFELTAYIEENGERVYSIYLIDPNLSTTEGLGYGDTVDDMKSLYGEDYTIDGTAYIYTKGSTLLSVITQNDAVIGIEYRLDR